MTSLSLEFSGSKENSTFSDHTVYVIRSPIFYDIIEEAYESLKFPFFSSYILKIIPELFLRLETNITEITNLLEIKFKLDSGSSSKSDRIWLLRNLKRYKDILSHLHSLEILHTLSFCKEFEHTPLDSSELECLKRIQNLKVACEKSKYYECLYGVLLDGKLHPELDSILLDCDGVYKFSVGKTKVCVCGWNNFESFKKEFLQKIEKSKYMSPFKDNIMKILNYQN